MMKLIRIFLVITFICIDVMSFSNETYTDHYIHNSFSKKLPSLNPALIMDFDIRTFNVGFTSIEPDSGKIIEIVKTVPHGLYWGSRIGYFNLIDKGKNLDKHLITIGIANNFFKQLSIGANVNYVYDIKDPYNKHHGTLDIGLSYNYLKHPLLGTHTIGVALQNALSFGTGSIQSFTQPAALDFTWRANLWENRFENVTNFSINNLYLNDEYYSIPDKEVNVYSDFKFRIKPIETSFGVGNKVFGASAGFRMFTSRNFNFNTGFKYHHFWDDVEQNSFGGYFNFELGKHKKEEYARRMGKVTGPGPGSNYMWMRKEYINQEYYNSLFRCGNMFLEWPDFYKNDWTLLFFTLNLKELELTKLIPKYKQIFLDKYKESLCYPFLYLEDMVRLNDLNNIDSLKDAFKKLTERSIEPLNKKRKCKKYKENYKYPDSLVYEAYLLMAENRIKNNNITEAIRYLDSIPEQYPIKLYADIKRCMIENQIDTITLNHIVKEISKINDTLHNRNIEEIYDFVFHCVHTGNINACTFNNIFYSASPLSKNKTEKWYGHALCKYESKEWENCLIECINVINFNGRAKLNARLLKAKCFKNLGMQDSAFHEIRILDSLITAIKENETIEKNELISKFPDIMKKQDSLGVKVDSLLNSSQSSFIVMQIDSLKPILEENLYKIKRYNELVRDAYKKKYDPFNLDVLHKEVKKLLRELEKKMTISK